MLPFGAFVLPEDRLHPPEIAEPVREEHPVKTDTKGGLQTPIQIDTWSHDTPVTHHTSHTRAANFEKPVIQIIGLLKGSG